jgi:hypothetical protein
MGNLIKDFSVAFKVIFTYSIGIRQQWVFLKFFLWVVFKKKFQKSLIWIIALTYNWFSIWIFSNWCWSGERGIPIDFCIMVCIIRRCWKHFIVVIVHRFIASWHSSHQSLQIFASYFWHINAEQVESFSVLNIPSTISNQG